MNRVILKPGREKSVVRKHPWIFTGAVQKVSGTPGPGETVLVSASNGETLALGSYSPHSQIVVRIWTWDLNAEIGLDFFVKKIRAAVAMREQLGIHLNSNAYRLVFSESDELPGLIADRFGDYLVCQYSSAGANLWKQDLAGALREVMPCRGIFERSDLEIRKKEGLGDHTGLLWGELPPESLTISEESRLFNVNIREGHKTGFYLDQRDNHSLVQCHSSGQEVLDCFSYTGGFSIAALKGQAHHVTMVDSSAIALEGAIYNAHLNGFTDNQFTPVESDVFRFLRAARDQDRKYDLVILDPPKFIESKSQIEKGARAYKDINLLAMKLLSPGGLLFTFSCSGHMEDPLFQKVVADAAIDAGRSVRFVRWLSQAGDHPVASTFPEGKYLKGLMAQVS